MDGSGVCTWLGPTTGQKLVSLLRSHAQPGQTTPLTAQDAFELQKQMAECASDWSNAPDKLPFLADCYYLWLGPMELL